jgi:cytochrome oxidase Cu insertion factor (SCO1/SenC/PrrC family)
VARAQFSPTAPLDLVAVAANSLHETEAQVRAFVTQHDLGALPNFYFVTGSLHDTRAVWNSYGISVTPSATSRMSVHADYFFLIDPTGHLRWIVPDDPLTGQALTQTSDVAELVSLLHQTGLR